MVAGAAGLLLPVLYSKCGLCESAFGVGAARTISFKSLQFCARAMTGLQFGMELA
jgi:hypothetical protein